MKMGKLGEEVSEKIKCAIRAKLTELGVHIDNELPDYVMVLVANKKTQKQMDEDLSLFLGESTTNFTTWLYDVLKKLEQFTISSKGMKRKIDEKKGKHKKYLSESENVSFNKKVKLKNETNSPSKPSENDFDGLEINNSKDAFEAIEALQGKDEDEEKGIEVEPLLPSMLTYSEEEERLIMGDDDDAINLHDNEGGIIADRPINSFEQQSADILVQSNDKTNNDNGEKDEIKSRERIKISWDTDNKTEYKYRNNGICKNKSNNDNKDRKGHVYENNNKSSLKEDEYRNNDNRKSEVKSSVRSGKVVDARDILKKKSSMAAKVKKTDERKERRGRFKKSRDRGSKENQSRSLKSVSKPVVREPEKPTVPSLVKVTPRPVRPPGMQPCSNLILKAVADAEKSIATTKLIQKKVHTTNDYDKEEEEVPGVYRRSRRENISVTLLNDRVVSSDVEITSNGHKNNIGEFDNTPATVLDPVQSFPSPVEETVETEEISSKRRNGHQKVASTEEVVYNPPTEPRFIITLDNTASDTEMEGEIDVTLSSEKCLNSDETVTVIRQPFDKSRLGPRLGPPVTEDLGINRDYRLFTIVDNTDSSQEMDLDSSEITSENGKSQTRCKYWPCCDAGSTCPYFHPTTLCRLFPACHFGDKCLYIHPACKFADKCLNVNCPFAHNSATPVIGKSTYKTPLPLSTPNGQICMYYPNCKKPFCPYLHIKKPCKFGSSCTKIGCEFEHPNRTVNKNPYKWVANQ